MNDLIEDTGPGNVPEYSVAELSGAVKRALEGGFGRVRVRGEVGRVFKARSGHLYYDIKDDRNVLACTTWKGQIAALSVIPEEGLEVVVTGRLTAYGAQSKYNLNVDEVTVAGQGALMALLEKRRKALAAEGLFDADRKRKLPFLPGVIGVVTSPSGAVIRDILHRLRDRFPRQVLIWPVAVQGAACAPEVARAIAGFNALPVRGIPRPDLLIVARGGGSVEDLWGFNEEIVVRAAAQSRIPLISAVGHETDITLIDHAADRRAPTPTAAAELAVPVRLELATWIKDQGARLIRSAANGVSQRQQRLRDLSRAMPRSQALLDTPRQRLDRAEERLETALARIVQSRQLHLAKVSGSLRPAALQTRFESVKNRAHRAADQLQPALSRALIRKADRLDTASARLRPDQFSRQIAVHTETLATHWGRLGSVAQIGLERTETRLSTAARLLASLGYQATLDRGYAVIRAGTKVLTTKSDAANFSALEIQFSDGSLPVTTGAKPQRKQTRAAPAKDDQGSLF